MMRAKFQVSNVVENFTPGTVPTKYGETVEFFPVTNKAFDGEGYNEDNTFARYTPGGSLRLEIMNPALWGQFKAGDKFYADFTPAPME